MQSGAGSLEQAVGILALQGCVSPHEAMLDSLGAAHIKVRNPEDLKLCSSLIMPGGESTTILKLIDSRGLAEPIVDFAKHHPVWGICAGAILAAKDVKNPEQASLGLIDIAAHRNYYGSQLESFKISLSTPMGEIEADFIRAPVLRPLSKDVQILACLKDQPVLMRQGRVLVSSFHTELGSNPELHRYFLNIPGAAD